MLASCAKPEVLPIQPDETEQTGGGDGTGGSDAPGDDNPSNPDGPSDPDDPSGQDPDNPTGPDTPTDPDTPSEPDPDGPGAKDPYSLLTVLNEGEKRPDKISYSPQHPETLHEVEYNDFFNSLQDELDEYGNIDYVCAQGGGTAFPIITDDNFIRFYQGSNAKDGGSYIRIRSKNGAKLLAVEVGSATKTSLAYSLNGKAAKSETTALAAGDHYSVSDLDGCTEVKITCMATDKNSRWELNYIKVNYQGGFVASDFELPAVEYGPLVQVPLPFTEDFETGFPSQGAKPSYYKYGQTDVGRPNMQWSTWYGSISWQNPLQGSQSPQLRLYQHEDDYDQSQYGSLKSEFFVHDLSSVEFDYLLTDFFTCATISYCDFGSTTWQNPTTVKLAKYADRETKQHFVYSLDEGKPHDAKIKIEISEDSSLPSSGHNDLVIDNICFR